jgi:hypothetical protein
MCQFKLSHAFIRTLRNVPINPSNVTLPCTLTNTKVSRSLSVAQVWNTRPQRKHKTTHSSSHYQLSTTVSPDYRNCHGPPVSLRVCYGFICGFVSSSNQHLYASEGANLLSISLASCYRQSNQTENCNRDYLMKPWILCRLGKYDFSRDSLLLCNSGTVISGFRPDVGKICYPLGCYIASSGSSVPTFRHNLSVPSSRVKKSSLTFRDVWVPSSSVKKSSLTFRDNASVPSSRVKKSSLTFRDNL